MRTGIVVSVAGILTCALGLISAAFAGAIIASDLTPQGLFAIQRYNYIAPFSPHEMAMITWEVISILILLLGLAMAVGGLILALVTTTRKRIADATQLATSGAPQDAL